MLKNDQRKAPHNENKKRHGQSGIETLIIIAVLAAALALFAPLAGKTKEVANAGIVVSEEKAAFERVVSVVKETQALGKGNELEENVKLGTETEIGNKNGEFYFSFRLNGKGFVFSEKINGLVLKDENGSEAESVFLEKGNYVFAIRGLGKEIEISVSEKAE